LHEPPTHNTVIASWFQRWSATEHAAGAGLQNVDRDCAALFASAHELEAATDARCDARLDQVSGVVPLTVAAS
jgi:hypothetical protein